MNFRFLYTDIASMLKIGCGYDFHILKEGRALMLGGVHIPFEKGEVAHSDGDVLLHAIADALLGAEGLQDLGELFPPEDEKWKDASSAKLLGCVWEKIKKNGWQIENIDCVVIIQSPKLNPYRASIIDSVSHILNIERERVFVKFKTHERVGEIGRGEAAACIVNALLKKDLK